MSIKKKRQELIERFREEKKISDERYFKKGKIAGIRWAKTASYDQIAFVQNYLIHERPSPHSTFFWLQSIKKVSSIYDYFQDIIYEDDFMDLEYDETGDFSPYSDIPNYHFWAFEKGWLSGVKNFWKRIRKQVYEIRYE